MSLSWLWVPLIVVRDPDLQIMILERIVIGIGSLGIVLPVLVCLFYLTLFSLCFGPSACLRIFSLLVSESILRYCLVGLIWSACVVISCFLWWIGWVWEDVLILGFACDGSVSDVCSSVRFRVLSSGSFSRIWGFGSFCTLRGGRMSKSWVFFFLLGLGSAVSRGSSGSGPEQYKEMQTSLNKVRLWVCAYVFLPLSAYRIIWVFCCYDLFLWSVLL